jgi:hypothetical protein
MNHIFPTLWGTKQGVQLMAVPCQDTSFGSFLGEIIKNLGVDFLLGTFG